MTVRLNIHTLDKLISRTPSKHTNMILTRQRSRRIVTRLLRRNNENKP